MKTIEPQDSTLDHFSSKNQKITNNLKKDYEVTIKSIIEIEK